MDERVFKRTRLGSGMWREGCGDDVWWSQDVDEVEAYECGRHVTREMEEKKQTRHSQDRHARHTRNEVSK